MAHTSMSNSTKSSSRFIEQVRRNLVALISVFIAVSSLSYNTWRNEETEHNRNQRMASFEVLRKIGELQELVFHSHYDPDIVEKGTPRTGWALVLTIRDLAQVLDAPLPDTSEQLVAIWGEHWQGLGTEQASADAVLGGIEQVREETLTLLRALD